MKSYVVITVDNIHATKLEMACTANASPFNIVDGDMYETCYKIHVDSLEDAFQIGEMFGTYKSKKKLHAKHTHKKSA